MKLMPNKAILLVFSLLVLVSSIAMAAAPVITSDAVTGGRVGKVYTYDVEATDADGDTISYEIDGPSGMTISSSTGLIRWTPSAEGSFSVTVNATDDEGDSDSQAFTIKVTDLQLSISDISVTCSPSCDDDDIDADNANSGDAGSVKEVEPGADVTVKVKVENLWADGTDDHDIENIELECTLEDIGDEDEQDESVDFDDLEPDESSDKEELSFNIATDAEDDESYDIDCELTGEDQDGSDYAIDFTITLDVEKEKHRVVIQEATMNPSAVSCNRVVSFNYDVQNVGGSDENDIRAELRIESLDVFAQQFLPELQEGDTDDDDTEYSGSFKFQVAEDAVPGTYQARFNIFYDDDDEEEVTMVDLVVQDCKVEEPKEEEPPKKEEEPVVVIQQPQTPVQPQTPQVIAEPAKTSAIEEFRNSTWFLVLLIGAIIIVLLIIALLIGLLIRM